MRRYFWGLLIAIALSGCVVAPAGYDYYGGPRPSPGYYTYPYPVWGGGYYYYGDGHRPWRHRYRGYDRD
ncbi:MAG TPA: hypothetical protein VJ673_03535 [Aromatoleum sp.]|uniref:hypothetical protein n=1 Tax=Aromatoleum sp. TaxID=2307007 RepID=UPI002B494FAD|nr:hypothetical protein [Aromatoleum sp.]HJV24729.1 hypothetical protein [Aromatoleum sp.]